MYGKAPRPDGTDRGFSRLVVSLLCRTSGIPAGHRHHTPRGEAPPVAMFTAMATTSTPDPLALLVSIHDVTPAMATSIGVLWTLCKRFGVTPALLVVPDWHGRWPLEHHPLFVSWLRERVDEGAEILLHGERHDEFGLPRSWADSLRAVGRTAREGEFLTLDHDGASERIARGVHRLQSLGVPPIGFVPPAWLARESTFEVVAAQGLLVSEDVRQVRIHGTGPRRLMAPVLRWSARSPLRARTSTAVAAWRDRRHRRHPLLRIALHPQDLGSTTTTSSLTEILERWSLARRLVSYGSLASTPRVG